MTEFLSTDPDRRMHSMQPGDIVSDYYGFPEVQIAILDSESTAARVGLDVEDCPHEVFDVIEAEERLREIMPPTPLDRSITLSADLGFEIYYKREETTPVSSFKVRGAWNKIAQLTALEKQAGILAASAGNHAQGVAYSAKILGIDAKIVMPVTAPDVKVEAVKALGAEVVLVGDSYSDAYEHSQVLAEKSGATFIHPFDDLDVIAGQGTIGLEILEQNPDTTHIFVPVGGGGLAAGIGRLIKTVRPDIKVIAVQSQGSTAMQRSVEKGYPVVLDHVGTFAGGVAVKQVGDITLDLVSKYVDEIVTVNNDEVSAAIIGYYNETKHFLEPAGALARAAISKYAPLLRQTEGAQCVAICSGGDISPSMIGHVAERAEIGQGKEVTLSIELPERPGTLRELVEIARNNNIRELDYRKNGSDVAHIFAGFGIRGERDRTLLFENLRVNGYAFDDLSHDSETQEHIKHMIGGTSTHATNERVYDIEFPERAGALADFLDLLGDRWNISIFNYTGNGGDVGRVLIAFEAADKAALEKALAESTHYFRPITSVGVEHFLGVKIA